MTTAVTERNISRPTENGANAMSERIYTVTGTDDEDTAVQAVDAEAPATVSADSITLYKKRSRVEPIGPNEWLASVTYQRKSISSTRPPVEPGDATRWSFTTLGGSTHVGVAIGGNIGRWTSAGAVGDSSYDTGGAMNVQDGRVEGLDVQVPILGLTATVAHTSAQVSSTYIDTLFDLTASVNDDTFTAVGKDFAAGEVLFLGVAGSQNDDGDWTLNYEFMCSPNATNEAIGGITVTSREGWDYLWAKYTEEVSSDIVIMKPYVAYVDRPYLRKDFDDLLV